MPHEKLYTAKEAAQAVLAKTQELLAKSDAMKAAPAHAEKRPEQDATPPDAVQASPNPAAPNDKVNGNPAPGAMPQNQMKYAAEGGTKGHIKLAKFVGRMEEKRKSKAAPVAPAMDKAEFNPNIKGVHQPLQSKKAGGDMTGSSQMALDNNSEKKEEVKRITSESKAMPKPKIPG